MSTARRSHIIKIEPARSKDKGDSKGKLIARFRINDFMSTKRISSFSSAE